MIREKKEDLSLKLKDNLTVNTVSKAVKGTGEVIIKSADQNEENSDTSPEALAAQQIVITSSKNASHTLNVSKNGNSYLYKNESDYLKTYSESVMTLEDTIRGKDNDVFNSENSIDEKLHEGTDIDYNLRPNLRRQDKKESLVLNGSTINTVKTIPSKESKEEGMKEKRRQEAIKRLNSRAVVNTSNKATDQSYPKKELKPLSNTTSRNSGIQDNKNVPSNTFNSFVKAKPSDYSVKDKTTGYLNLKASDVKQGGEEIKSAEHIMQLRKKTEKETVAVIGITIKTGKAISRAAYGVIKVVTTVISKAVTGLISNPWLALVIAIVAFFVTISAPLLAIDSISEDAEDIAGSLVSSAGIELEKGITESLAEAGWNEAANSDDIVQFMGSTATYWNTLAMYYAILTVRGEAPKIEELYHNMNNFEAEHHTGMIFNSGRYDAINENGETVEVMIEIEEENSEGEVKTVIRQKDGDDSKEAAIHAPQVFSTWLVTVTEKSIEELTEQFDLSETELDMYNFYTSEEGQELLFDKIPEEYLNEATDKNSMVTLALEEYNNQDRDPAIKSGSKYSEWFGFDEKVQSDMIFLTWLAAESGYIDSYFIDNIASVDEGSINDRGTCPFTSSAEWAADWFKARGLWQDEGYQPKAGDYVFLDQGNDSKIDAVGLVYIEEGEIYVVFMGEESIVIEKHAIEVRKIVGYGMIVYQEKSM